MESIAIAVAALLLITLVLYALATPKRKVCRVCGQQAPTECPYCGTEL